jgi:translation initiation factor IF-2
MQAPVVGGVRLPHGNGETVRLARGASLSDFAEKIDANPAALVQALFNLGEMVTATQSVGDETLELLGGEMNYVVQVVSPEDEDRELLQSFDLTYGEDSGGEDDLVVGDVGAPCPSQGGRPLTLCAECSCSFPPSGSVWPPPCPSPAW